MKRLGISLLTVLMLVSMCPWVTAANINSAPSAEQSSLLEIKSFPSGEKYVYNHATGEIIAKAFTYNEAGELVELDVEEYVAIKTSQPTISGSSVSPEMVDTAVLPPDGSFETGTNSVGYSYVYDFRETTTHTRLGDPVKVSADMKGPGYISYFTSTSVNETFGGGLSLSLTIKNAIKIGASFDWNASLTTRTTIGYTYSVPAGYTGYVQFTPYYNVTVGDLYYLTITPFDIIETNMGEVWGASPKELPSGLADGIYELKLY